MTIGETECSGMAHAMSFVRRIGRLAGVALAAAGV